MAPALDPARRLAELAPGLPPATAGRLGRYAQLLCKWNRAMNLVGPGSLDEILERHFLDCLLAASFLAPALAATVGAGVLDIGSGAGFPGLVLAACHPEHEITLAEPRAKRQAFLAQVVRELGLTRVRILGERLDPNQRRQLAEIGGRRLVTGRGVSEPLTFLALAAPFCAPGGGVALLAGPSVAGHLAAWRAQPPLPHLALAATHPYRLPSGRERFLLLFTTSPDAHPRSPSGRPQGTEHSMMAS